MSTPSPATIRVLRRCGWRPGRRIDIRPWRTALETLLDAEPSPHILRFIEEFGGLSIRSEGAPRSPQARMDVIADPGAALPGATDLVHPMRVDDYMLLAVGDGGDARIWYFMDPRGRLYMDMDGDLFLVGLDYASGIENVLAGRFLNEI